MAITAPILHRESKMSLNRGLNHKTRKPIGRVEYTPILNSILHARNMKTLIAVQESKQVQEAVSIWLWDG